MSSSVKVAVRVRPFNSREREMNSTCIISMNGPQCRILNPSTSKPHTFTYDYSYFSFDSAAPNYAGQQSVFDDIGQEVLRNAWEGYNCSLFAYGQTGSGKSYSMVGYGENKGIIPLACEEIFRRIGGTPQGEGENEVKFVVQCTMIEIYKEKVKDLLNPRHNPPAGLAVREHPKTGPYVQGLKATTVRTYAEIEKVMDQGNAARTVGATKMNQTSSRAHTLVSIILSQVRTIRGKQMKKTSKINLVDLAGSEKLKNTGSTGSRKQEGIAINKSLSSLGNCISALADRASGRKVFIPYRNSKLTFIMKESLGGNSKTCMIAAISPASINYEESMSTLRYASRAKKIQNKARVNEDPTAKLIKELRAEIAGLKAQLASGGSNVDAEATGASLAHLCTVMEDITMTDDEREARDSALREAREGYLKDFGIVDFDKTKQVHLLNLNEDPSLSENLLYGLQIGTTTIGRAKGARLEKDIDDLIEQEEEEGEDAAVAHAEEVDPEQDFQADLPLSGHLEPHHATIEVVAVEQDDVTQDVYIIPEPGAKTYINGQLLCERTRLTHRDRIVFDTAQFFCLVHPEQAATQSGKVIDFEEALTELADTLAEDKARAIIEQQKAQFEAESRALQTQMDELREQSSEAAEMVEQLQQDHDRQEQATAAQIAKTKMMMKWQMLARSDREKKELRDEYNEGYLKLGVQKEFTNLVMITVAEGRNLKIADVFTRSSDPYMIIKIISKDGDVTHEQRTRIIKRNLNPYWNETHCFRVKNTDRIRCECWDWDRITRDDKLGYFELTLEDIPKKKMEKWYTLQNVSHGEIRLKLWNGDCLFVPGSDVE